MFKIGKVGNAPLAQQSQPQGQGPQVRPRHEKLGWGGWWTARQEGGCGHWVPLSVEGVGGKWGAGGVGLVVWGGEFGVMVLLYGGGCGCWCWGLRIVLGWGWDGLECGGVWCVLVGVFCGRGCVHWELELVCCGLVWGCVWSLVVVGLCCCCLVVLVLCCLGYVEVGVAIGWFGVGCLVCKGWCVGWHGWRLCVIGRVLGCFDVVCVVFGSG